MVEPEEIKTGHLYELTSVSLPCHRHASRRTIQGASLAQNRQNSNEAMFTDSRVNVAVLAPRTEDIKGNVGVSKFPEI